VDSLRRPIADLSMIDIGSGNGAASAKAYTNLGMHGGLQGYDVLVHKSTPGAMMQHVKLFDGVHIPETNASFDVISFTYVLHHTRENTLPLLREAARVTREWAVIAEDHLNNQAGDPIAVARHQSHDRTAVFRDEGEWRQLFDAAGFHVIASGPMFDVRSLQNYYILRKKELSRACGSVKGNPKPCARDVALISANEQSILLSRLAPSRNSSK